MANNPKECIDERPCFARKDGKCTILKKSFRFMKKRCPFCKERKEVTNGVYYPYNPYNDGTKKDPEADSESILTACES